MEEINIAFLGDIMPGGLFCGKNDILSLEVAKILSSFDVRIATLECAIGDGLEFDVEKMQREDWRNIIYANNDDIYKLKYLGVDVVSLANNHVFDLGEEGLVNTIHLLDSLGIKYCGAGLNKELASRPAVFSKNGKTFAILAYMPYWWEAPHPAMNNRPGINLLYMDQVVSDIKDAKMKYEEALHRGASEDTINQLRDNYVQAQSTAASAKRQYETMSKVGETYGLSESKQDEQKRKNFHKAVRNTVNRA